MGVARRPDERQGGTLEDEANTAIGVGPARPLQPADHLAGGARARTRARRRARFVRAARRDHGQEAPARLLPGAGDPRPLRDVDRRRRVPRRRRAPARRLGPGAAARSRSVPTRRRSGASSPASTSATSASSTVPSTGSSPASTRCSSASRSRSSSTRRSSSTTGPPARGRGRAAPTPGKVAWHPLLCFVAESGEWLHGKLRNGHAAPSTGARGFLAECLRRLPAGARLYLRADEGFFGQDFLAELEAEDVTYTVGAPLIPSVRARIAEIPAGDWLPASYREGSEVASFEWQPKTWKRARRFVVRRDPLERGEQLTLEGSRVALLGARHQRPRALGRRARVLAPRQGQRREPDPGGQARPGARQPPLPGLPRQLGLPALHPARLRPARLAEAARAPGGRAAEATPSGCASASSASPAPSVAAAAGSCCACRPATRSSLTSSARSRACARSRGRPPDPLLVPEPTPLARSLRRQRPLDQSPRHRCAAHLVQPCPPPAAPRHSRRTNNTPSTAASVAYRV